MQYTENAINVLAARTYKGIGRAWIIKNLSSIKTESQIVAMLNKDAKTDQLITIDDFERKKNFLKAKLSESAHFIDGVVSVGDPDFPAHKGVVKDSEKPVFIFYKGNISLLTTAQKNIAVIGLLNPDEAIEDIEKFIVTQLVMKGVIITSGLAVGCDTIAHKQALDLNAKTIAILPSPLSEILPAKNRPLAEEIIKKTGLIITEYLTPAKSRTELTSRYQERDRLQALFCDGIILSASYAKNDQGNDSGSRLAMQFAIDYGIPIAVIYNSETDGLNEKYELNRQYITNQKTTVVINKNNYINSIEKLLSLEPANNCNQTSFLDFI